MSHKRHSEVITQCLKKCADDWLIIPEFHGYTGPRTEIGKVRAADRRNREHYQRLQYLKRKKWIEVKKTEKGLKVKLNDLGRMQLLARDIRARPKLAGGKSIILIFDFPESARNGRDAFRYFIKKKLGFKLVQLSVWQSDRDCLKDLERFMKDARISVWVKAFLANEINVDNSSRS